MPVYQRLLERANYKFASSEIGRLNPEQLSLPREADDGLLPRVASALGIAMTDGEMQVVRRCPMSIQVAMIAIAQSAVTRSQQAGPVPITFAWKSGYDFELSVFEARPGPDSWGGVTLLLTTPYPG